MSTTPPSLPHQINDHESLRAIAERLLADLNGYDGIYSGDHAEETEVQQAMVFLEALCTMRGRQQGYKDVWRLSGWRGMLFDVKKKAERLWFQYWFGGGAEHCDSGIDIINYAAFFVRQFRAGDEHGHWHYGEVHHNGTEHVADAQGSLSGVPERATDDDSGDVPAGSRSVHS